MCGIVGYTGHVQAAPILLDGLARLEYPGYDSAGLAVRNGSSPAEVVKAIGKLYHLADKTDQGRALPGTCGIGHTRWATHGDPSMVNAHPHVSGNCSGSGSGTVESDVVGVHNGIIENFTELKKSCCATDIPSTARRTRRSWSSWWIITIRNIRSGRWTPSPGPWSGCGEATPWP